MPVPIDDRESHATALWRLVQQAASLLHAVSEALAPGGRGSELLTDRLRFEPLEPGRIAPLMRSRGQGIDPDLVEFAGALIEYGAARLGQATDPAAAKAGAYVASHPRLNRPEVVLGVISDGDPQVLAMARAGLIRPAARRTSMAAALTRPSRAA